jgi:IMP dehydrogenase
VTNDIEIGQFKSARQAWALDDVAIVPNRRTRDAEDVSTSWRIDAYTFDTPFIGAPMDSVMSPETAIMLGRLGGLGVLNLEGIWTRHEDAEAVLKEITSLESERERGADPKVTRRLQELLAAPIRPELIKARLEQIREAGVVVAGSLTPQRIQEHYKTVLEAGVELFVIRGNTVSAEHVSTNHEPLNLKRFIYELDVPVIVGGAAGYTPALHLMRTGAAGVLVGFGGGATGTTRRGRRCRPVRVPRRVRRTLRPRDRRRRRLHLRRHRQGPGLRRRRRHARHCTGPRRGGPRPWLALGHGGGA